MSISASLSNALSGLSASSRAAELVSSNVANAMTEGYGRREIELSARVLSGAGAGVQVDGVRRMVDEVLLRDRRFADAGASYDQGRADFLQRLSTLVGTPDLDSSLAGRMRRFEASLIEAASRPDSLPRLQAVVDAANGVTGELNAISDGIQAARQDADRSIAGLVATLNETLEQIAGLNNDIGRLNGAGRDVTALEDRRQMAIDRLSAIVPVREVPRDDGKIALYTTGGAVLLDGPPARFGFTETPTITADMTLASGALSGLTMNGREIFAYGSNARLGGGSLAAAFAVRDDLAVTAQARLDSVARDLVDRFSDPAVDPTIAPGSAGFFADGTGAFDPLDETGLAGRIRLNSVVDPAAGGDLSRIRDGLYAPAPGDAGDATRINALIDALGRLRLPSSGDVTGSARGAADLAGDLLSRIQSGRTEAEATLGFSAAKLETLKTLELSKGVDTDQEMQKLLLIEQSYAANARVIQVVDDMLERLIGL